jgi:hypothetical protein
VAAPVVAAPPAPAQQPVERLDTARVDPGIPGPVRRPWESLSRSVPRPSGELAQRPRLDSEAP